MNRDIEAAVAKRGISRLCHFTPARNLAHIAAGDVGLLSTASLEADERAAYNPTDLARLDGKKTHICCSIEFPNAWYFDNARAGEKLFTDWVVLLISPRYLADDQTLFSPRNAASDYGRHITNGIGGFHSLFAKSVDGARGTTRSRGALHLQNCPTDEQAEILVYDRILMDHIIGVAVPSIAQAGTERGRLRVNGVDPDRFRFVVAPQMFDKYVLSGVIRRGIPASEVEYRPTVVR